MTTNILKTRCDGYWQWFKRTDTSSDQITGKYLFFSTNRDLLVQIVLQELSKGGFHLAKIPMVGVNSPSIEEYVLCLYYKNDSRKHELASKYYNYSNLKYRYWKSDQDTRQKKYSKEFVEKMSSSEV